MQTWNQDKKIAEVLADFLVNQEFEDLPEETIEKAKFSIIDLIGCTVGASKEAQARILIEVMKAEGGTPCSSVIGEGFKTSVANAALMNGTLGHIFDFDDDHREGAMHPSVAVFPAVFALGEKMKVSGKELMRAYILGLEVALRVGESFLGKSYYQGFHPTGICGIFGAAAGCALVLGLDAKQTTYALGLAGSFASGTMEWSTEGSWQKPLQAGHAAMMGVLSASLAEKEFIGARTVFDGPSGVIRAYSFKEMYDYAYLTENLGRRWSVTTIDYKVHACCRFGAAAADCAMDLYRQGVRAKDVESVVAKVGDYTIHLLCTPPERKVRPLTHVDAQFSLPYTVAVAICKNQTGTSEFKGEALLDPEVLELAKKVTWEMDPQAEAMYPKAYPATLVATLNDGRRYESRVVYAKGDPENPVTFAEIVDKFNSLTKGFLSQEKLDEIIHVVKHFERIDNIATLADLIR